MVDAGEPIEFESAPKEQSSPIISQVLVPRRTGHSEKWVVFSATPPKVKAAFLAVKLSGRMTEGEFCEALVEVLARPLAT